MIAALLLPEALRAKIESEARAVLPRECCGLIEGVIENDCARANKFHPARNLSKDDDRFEIDPADHFHAQRAARQNGNAIIGCYHSHPDGRAEPSEGDLQGAVAENFVWLICGVDEGRARIGAFVFDQGRFRAVELQECASA